jgi:hypothetical protein
MSSDSADAMESRFPINEEFESCTGQKIQMTLSLYKRPSGDFSIRATESTSRTGFVFEVYGPAYSNPAVGQALGRLRARIRKRLAIRYLNRGQDGEYSLTHDKIIGRITTNGVSVDPPANL